MFWWLFGNSELGYCIRRKENAFCLRILSGLYESFDLNLMVIHYHLPHLLSKKFDSILVQGVTVNVFQCYHKNTAIFVIPSSILFVYRNRIQQRKLKIQISTEMCQVHFSYLIDD